MKEHIYNLYQKSGPAPVIKKLGAIKLGMEQTPVIFKGESVIVESCEANEECAFQHIVARNIKTGLYCATLV